MDADRSSRRQQEAVWEREPLIALYALQLPAGHVLSATGGVLDADVLIGAPVFQAGNAQVRLDWRGL